MKTLILLTSFFLLSLSRVSYAQTLHLSEYNYEIRDLKTRGLSKENLYQKMNRRLVRHQDSICSNRAHVWAWDFKISDIDSPKIFLFFTSKTGRFDGVSWWYHVSPLVNHGGKLWVMDAGYPKKVNTPLGMTEWMKTFAGEKSNCKEIKSTDTELVKKMYSGNAFPETTAYGKYDCYFKITPAGYWTPAQIARNILGHDENGRPTNFNRDEMDAEEVMEACIEASTTPLGWTWGTSLNRCRYFIQNGSLKI